MEGFDNNNSNTNSSSSSSSSTSREEEYMKSLNLREKQVYDIAKNHLKMSFSIKRSVGYKDWIQTNIGMNPSSLLNSCQ